ncbi:MAG TPA: hypothetical protein PKH39_13495 [Woeseiaceae bacterium]|nr:hypothetical protein [Woeseiaceae bacterium]
MKNSRFIRSICFLKVVLAITAALTLSAFRHTDVQGYTDPNYVGHTFHAVVVQFPNASLSFRNQAIKQLSKQLKKRGIRLYQHDELFAPTREWSEDATRAVYEQNGIDAGLVITLGSTGSETTPGAVLFNASSVGGTTTGYATQVTFHSDHASFEIALVDIDTKDTIWIGELDTRGAGLLYTGSKSTAKGLVKGLIKEWDRAGHLVRR